MPAATLESDRQAPLLQKHAYLRDVVAAFSLANLFFLNIWSELTNPASVDFFQKSPVAGHYLGITIANILIVGIFIFAAMLSARRLKGLPRLAAELAFLGCVAVPLNILRTRFLYVPLGFRSWQTALATGLIGITLLVVLRWRRPFLRFVRAALIMTAPLLPVAYSTALMQQARMSAADEFTRTLTYPKLHAGQGKGIRVVWVIFDELDACFAFSNRSPNVRLPQLDRLQEESVYATKAKAPAQHTIMSIPSLFTGKVVQKSVVDGLSDLKVRYAGTEGYHLFSKEPTVFSRAHDLGYNTGVDGWFLPYCRLFPFTSCYWEPITGVFLREDYARYLNFAQSMWFQLSRQLVEIPGVYAIRNSVGQEAVVRIPRARRTSREHSILEYRRIHAQSDRVLLDRDIDFVYLHWPTPHGLFYYDRRTSDFTTSDGPNYFDSLALVDRTVGDIRRVLEQAGTWNQTVLLVSSDHPLRTDFLRDIGMWSPEENRAMGSRVCPYVPFILKMPGQESPVRYDRPFNTVVTGDLLLAILQGEVSSPSAITQWLNTHNPTASSVASTN